MPRRRSCERQPRSERREELGLVGDSRRIWRPPCRCCCTCAPVARARSPRSSDAAARCRRRAIGRLCPGTITGGHDDEGQRERAHPAPLIVIEAEGRPGCSGHGDAQPDAGYGCSTTGNGTRATGYPTGVPRRRSRGTRDRRPPAGPRRIHLRGRGRHPPGGHAGTAVPPAGDVRAALDADLRRHRGGGDGRAGAQRDGHAGADAGGELAGPGGCAGSRPLQAL